MRCVLPRFPTAIPPPVVNPLYLNLLTQAGDSSCRFKYRAGSLPRLANLTFKMAGSTITSSGSSVLCAQADGHGDGGSGSDVGDYAEIIVVRHGETLWNADGRIQGHLDVELNDVGRQQAAAVADRLSKESKISAVYSSDLKRALETAQIIAISCGGLEVIQDQDLRERNLGDLQGLVLREAATMKTKAYCAFLSKSTDQILPGGGESLDQLYQRCTSALQRISKKHKGERVVVVAHGGVVRALYKRASPKGTSQGKIQNTSVNIFHISGEDWVIKTWNDVSHLSKSGFLKNAFGGDSASDDPNQVHETQDDHVILSMPAISKTKHRGPNMTVAEDEALCQAYLRHSLDAGASTDPIGGQLWTRILKTFEELTPNTNGRTMGSLSNRFKVITHQVNMFIECLTTSQMQRQNGSNDWDVFEEAREIYKQRSGKKFLLEGCYEILRVFPKFVQNSDGCLMSIPVDESFESPQDSPTTPNANPLGTSETENLRSNSNINSTDNGDTSRPLGFDADKEGGRKKIKLSDFRGAGIKMMEDTSSFYDFFKATIEKRELGRQKKEEERLARIDRAYEMEIMGKDMRALEPQQREYYRAMQNEILIRHRIRRS